MFSKQKLTELLRDYEAAHLNYLPFYSTGPLDPGKPIKTSTEFMEASERLEKAKNALDDYYRQFIDKNGHQDLKLDEK